MTLTDTGRKIGRAVMAWTDRYEAQPFAMTFRLLRPVLIWLALVLGSIELLGASPAPLPTDPGRSFADGVGAGVLIGTAATAGAHGVLYLIARRRRAG